MRPFGLTMRGSKPQILERLAEEQAAMPLEEVAGGARLLEFFEGYVAALPDRAEISLSMSVLLNYWVPPEVVLPREVGP